MKVTNKNLISVFPKLSREDRMKIVRLCNGTLDPMDFKAGMERYNECYNHPGNTNLVLTVINSLLDGYGVESVPFEENALYNDDFISYVNFGDTYSTTVLYNPEKRRFEIGDWGSLYETSPACKAIDDQYNEEQ